MPSGLRWGILLLIVVAAGAFGWYWVQSHNDAAPEGFARANGRLEAERIDVATKFAGRLREIFVQEGDLVRPGQRIAVFDTADLEAQLRQAEANVRQARELLNQAKFLLAQRKSELTLANQELERAEALVARGHVSRQTADQRRAQQATAAAAVNAAEAQVAQADASIDAAVATVEGLQADLADHTLYAPRLGRVQYRLAEPGEVLAAGGRVVTLLDLTDVYMTIYLPTAQAGRLSLGAEARLIFDAAPEYVVPGTVTFVASEAQFTPKYVETESEREKLMFRVKVKIPPEILERYIDVVKAGVPGICYVKIDPEAQWPESLAVRLPP
jgi:HlyD family secretion protein